MWGEDIKGLRRQSRIPGIDLSFNGIVKECPSAKQG